jgi:glycosyltransferase involved in cell wall biosynthesis
MKILQVINNLDVGGAETLLSAYALNSRENTSIILTLVSSDSWIKSDLENEGVKVIDLALHDKYRFFGAIRGIANAILSEKPDIVNAHLFPPQYYLAFLRLFFRKIPFVFSEHSTSNRRRGIALLKPLDALSYRIYDRVIVISEAARKELCRLYPGQNCTIVYGGADEKRFSGPRNEEFDFILVVSLRGKEKGVDVFLEALSMIKDRGYTALVLGDGVMKNELIELRDRLGLKKTVDFKGNVDNVGEYLRKARVFVLPSRWEGLPVSIMEAMFAGTAVVASRTGGVPEVVPENECALLFEPEDSEDLAKTLVKVLEDCELRLRLAENARKRAGILFTLSAFTSRLDSFYSEMKRTRK